MLLQPMILILQLPQFLLIPPQQVDLLLQMRDDDLLLIGLHPQWRVKVIGSLRAAHLIINTIKYSLDHTKMFRESVS